MAVIQPCGLAQGSSEFLNLVFGDAALRFNWDAVVQRHGGSYGVSSIGLDTDLPSNVRPTTGAMTIPLELE
jgi:hypothetical protein